MYSIIGEHRESHQDNQVKLGLVQVKLMLEQVQVKLMMEQVQVQVKLFVEQVQFMVGSLHQVQMSLCRVQVRKGRLGAIQHSFLQNRVRNLKKIPWPLCLHL